MAVQRVQQAEVKVKVELTILSLDLQKAGGLFQHPARPSLGPRNTSASPRQARKTGRSDGGSYENAWSHVYSWMSHNSPHARSLHTGEDVPKHRLVLNILHSHPRSLLRLGFDQDAHISLP